MFKKYYFAIKNSQQKAEFYYIKDCYFYYELGEPYEYPDHWHISKVYRNNTTTGLTAYFLREAIKQLNPNIDRGLLDVILAFELAEILHSLAKRYIH